MNAAYREMIDGAKNPANTLTAFVQWKGSNVCIDVQCECGNDVHIDSVMFAYYFHCPECDRYYALCPDVKLIPIVSDEARAELIADDCAIEMDED